MTGNHACSAALIRPRVNKTLRENSIAILADLVRRLAVPLGPKRQNACALPVLIPQGTLLELLLSALWHCLG